MMKKRSDGSMNQRMTEAHSDTLLGRQQGIMRRTMRFFSPRSPKHSRAYVVLAVICVVLLLTGLLSWRSSNGPAIPAASVKRLPPDPAFKGLDETLLTHSTIDASSAVCAVCTDGLVYVHVGRRATAEERWSDRPRAFTVAEELYVEPRTAPVFTATSGSADEVVSRCLAQLVSLGQLGVAQSGIAVLERGKPQLTASVIVDFDSATPQTSLGVGGRCPGFLAEVRPSTNTSGTVKMDVAYPRLPSWPLPPPPPGAAPTESTGLPPYFGTVAVRETDVDKDVRPPLSVALTEDRGAVVIRFGEDETSTRPEPFEMRCPAHFMSVFIGRFGRQHNQVQEVMQALVLAGRVNRTYIVPVLVAESYIPQLRYDAQKLYGFNALRREGGYCLVTYEEARRMFKMMEAEQMTLSLRRFNYYADPRPMDSVGWWAVNQGEWFNCPWRQHDDDVKKYNIDAFLEDVRARSPPVTTVNDNRSDGMFFYETENDVTINVTFPNGGEDKYVRVALMRKALALVVDLLGGDHQPRVEDGKKPQPLLAMMSARMAFYAHPSLREMTRVMGLLRPSAAINREADRYYSKDAAQLGWPTAGLKRRADGTLVDTLRPSHFKNVIGIHLRHREGTCRNEANIIDRTTYAIDPRFQLEQTEPSWSGPFSTFRNMELDCAISNPRVVELYKQYTRWMRANMTTARSAAADALVPTMYLAYDDEGGPVVPIVEGQLGLLREGANSYQLWTPSVSYPEKFVGAYDVRINGSYLQMHAAVVKGLNERDKKENGDEAFEEKRRVDLVDALYQPSYTEMLAMAVDYFFMTNTGVFRGVTLSSVSTNVMMRRWGRGLPCHGVLAGYMVSFYSSMWPVMSTKSGVSPQNAEEAE